jgi:hypothetical protein
VNVARLWVGCAASLLVALGACDGAFDLVHVASPRDGSVDGDGSAIDGEVDAALPICLEDSFSDNVIDLALWEVFGGADGVVVKVTAGGVAEIILPATTTSAQDPYGGLTGAERRYSGTAAQVEIVQVPDRSAPTELAIQYSIDSANHYRMSVVAGTLSYGKSIAGVRTDTDVEFDFEHHRVLQMRHDTESSELVFEARGATGTFVELGRTAADVSLDMAYFEVYAGTFDIGSSAAVQFDNVRVIGACP